MKAQEILEAAATAAMKAREEKKAVARKAREEKKTAAQNKP